MDQVKIGIAAITGCSDKFVCLIEDYCKGVQRWRLILGTASLTATSLWLYDVILHRDEIIPNLKSKSFRLLKRVPKVRETLETEMKKTKKAILETMFEDEEREMEAFFELPKTGSTQEQVLELAASMFKMGKYEWKNGKVSGGINAGDNEEYTDLMVRMFNSAVWTNPLHQDIFPGIRKMESEIVRMTINIFNGDARTVGCVTSGGTESLIMAMKAYRDWGREIRGVHEPEVVAATTVHAAVEKGAGILGYKFRMVPIDSTTLEADLKAIKHAINKNTVVIVVSAPEYAHGIIDDVEGIARLAQAKGIPLHVDCCLGGYILPFMEEAGYPLKTFDFRVPGVTSISADTHKYGNAPKGTSVLMYRTKEFMHHQYFVTPDWPGGIYATPTISGSRPGVNIAMCWAALLSHGQNGYVDTTKKIIAVARYLKEEINKINEFFIFGDPLGPVVAFGSQKVNIYQVADEMIKLGWHLQPLQNPPGIHIFLTSLHTKPTVALSIIRDLKKVAQTVRLKPAEATSGLAKLYGMVTSLPDKSLVVDAAMLYIDSYYTLAKEAEMSQD